MVAAVVVAVAVVVSTVSGAVVANIQRSIRKLILFPFYVLTVMTSKFPSSLEFFAAGVNRLQIKCDCELIVCMSCDYRLLVPRLHSER